MKRRTAFQLLAFVCGLHAALAVACAPRDDEASTREATSPEPTVSTAADDALAARRAQLFADEAFWPTRVWLEEPLLDESGAVLVKPKRPGVVIFMRENGDVRVDFGRQGPHTVPVSMTNFASEAQRLRAGPATKTQPNLLGMLSNRIVDIDGDHLRPTKLDLDAVRGGRLLLVFADAARSDVAALTDFATEAERAGDLRLTTFIPVTDELDGDVAMDLKAGGWNDPFLMTPMAKSYLAAMLEPGTPRPFVRLATDEGRILVEGPPDASTLEAVRAALGG